jgi:hypothetical protein
LIETLDEFGGILNVRLMTVIALHVFLSCFFASIEDITNFQQALQNAVLLPAETVSLTQEYLLTRIVLSTGEDGGTKGFQCVIPATIANPNGKEVRHYRRDRFIPVNATCGGSSNCKNRRWAALPEEGKDCIESSVKPIDGRLKYGRNKRCGNKKQGRHPSPDEP